MGVAEVDFDGGEAKSKKRNIVIARQSFLRYRVRVSVRERALRAKREKLKKIKEKTTKRGSA